MMIVISLRTCFTYSSHKYSIRKNVDVPFESYYDAVKHTEKYKNFIPWCIDSKIIKSAPNYNQTVLTISFKLYNMAYTSKVYEEKTENKTIITSICQQQPFKHLESVWSLSKIGPQKTDIQYDVEFQFRNFLYQRTSGMFLNFIGKEMYEIFTKEAIRKRDQQINKKNSGDQLKNLLNQYPNIKKQYEINKQFRIKIDNIHNLLKGDPDYQTKMVNQSENLMLYIDCK